MSKKAVFCIATSRHQAEQIVDHLKTESFPKNDISALSPDRGATRDLAPENNTKTLKAAVSGTGSGAETGGALAWLAMSRATGFPEVTAAGPIAAELGDKSEGGIAGGLVRLGIPATDAKLYEGKVKSGNSLLAVHTDDAGDLARVKDIFTQAGAQDICTPDADANATKTSSASGPVSPPAKLALV